MLLVLDGHGPNMSTAICARGVATRLRLSLSGRGSRCPPVGVEACGGDRSHFLVISSGRICRVKTSLGSLNGGVFTFSGLSVPTRTVAGLLWEYGYVGIIVCSHIDSRSTERSASERITSLRGLTTSENCAIYTIFRRGVDKYGTVGRHPILLKYLSFYASTRGRMSVLLIARISHLKHSALRVLGTLSVLRGRGIDICVRGLGVRALLPSGAIGPLSSLVAALLNRLTTVRQRNVLSHLGDNHTLCVRGNNHLNEGPNDFGDHRRGGRRCGRTVSLLGGNCSVHGITGLANETISAVRAVGGRFVGSWSGSCVV